MRRVTVTVEWLVEPDTTVPAGPLTRLFAACPEGSRVVVEIFGDDPEDAPS